jgi:hypothetical protein
MRNRIDRLIMGAILSFDTISSDQGTAARPTASAPQAYLIASLRRKAAGPAGFALAPRPTPSPPESGIVACGRSATAVVIGRRSGGRRKRLTEPSKSSAIEPDSSYLLQLTRSILLSAGLTPRLSW